MSYLKSTNWYCCSLLEVIKILRPKKNFCDYHLPKASVEIKWKTVRIRIPASKEKRFNQIHKCAVMFLIVFAKTCDQLLLLILNPPPTPRAKKL